MELLKHALGFTPRHYYPGSSGVPLAAPQSRLAAQTAPPITPVFVALPPHETPIYAAHPTMRLPRSASEPVLKVPDSQYYAPEPTLQMNEPYGYTQPPAFPFDTEKPVATEEQDIIAQKLKILEQAMRNLQGIGDYRSVSYKDLCMFPDINLSLGFKMPKFEKYAGHGDPVAHLRRYCNQLRAAGGKEELLMAFFGESLSDLASEWFIDRDIDKWNSWDDLASEFVQHFQYNINLILNKKSLVNMKKKNTEGFREYAIRWREQAARVKPPMKESKLVEVFIQAQDETYFQHLLPEMGKSFMEVLKMGEMIEDGIKTD